MTEEELKNVMEWWKREEMKPVTQREVALHEAGHAVMSLFCGVGVAKVQIKWPEIDGSLCMNTTASINIANRLRILYAGPAAMAQGSKLRVLADDRYDGEDLEIISELANRAFPDNKKFAQCLTTSACIDAWDLVNTEWMQRQIQAVAHALCEKGQLSGRQVRNIVRRI